MKCVLCMENVIKDEDYYFCSHCELVFKEHSLILSEQDEASRYRLHNNTNLDENYLSYFKNIAKIAVLPYINGACGLDYGSGENNVFEEVLRKDYNLNVDSYDKYFHPKYNLKSEYDFITCIEVIEHIKYPDTFFEEIDCFLRKGGCLIFKTCFHNNNKEDFFNWWYIRDKTHITFYTVKTFEYLANKFNYEITYYDDKSIVVMTKM